MIKNYFSVLWALLFCMTAYWAHAQVTAGNDYVAAPFANETVMLIPNVLANDTVNGLPANASNVTFTTIAANYPFVSIEADGSVWVTNGALSNAGVYTIYYRITEIADPLNYDIGAVTINLGSCLLPDMTTSNLVAPTCSSAGSVTLNNLPDGNWTLTIWRNGVEQLNNIVQGSGNSYTFNAQFNSIYHFSVYGNNCASMPVRVDLFSQCALLLDFTSDYVDLNSDGAVSQGDVVNYGISVFNGRDEQINYIHVTPGLSNSQIIIHGSPIPSLLSGQTDTTTYTGTRLITQADINAGYVADRVDVLGTVAGEGIPIAAMSSNYATTYLDITDGLRLSAFYDTNNNGTQDNGEANFTRGHFEYQINDGPAQQTISNRPFYLYENNPANAYDIRFVIDAENALYYTVASGPFENITIAAGSGITNYNFPITVAPHNDLTVSLTPYSSPRPGFTYSNIITYRNNGTSPVSGTVTFTHNPAVSINNISVSGTVATANGFAYDFTDLQPNAVRNITVKLNVPMLPTVALGDLLAHTASVSLAPEDVNPANNQSNLSQTIIGSYDPNNKTESHGRKILHSTFTSDDFLTYTIRFENRGTAEAFNVRIEDELDDRLDASSVRMVDASHTYVMNRNENNLIWRMDGINLPPSAGDSEVGHGFVTFTIKPKPGYAVGDIIENKADIYFDFNPAIVTEPAVTEFIAPLSVRAFKAGMIAVYPNPVKNMLHIDLKKATSGTVRLCDILGKTIREKSLGQSTQLDLSGLSGGVYFAKVSADGNSQTFKIIKQ